MWKYKVKYFFPKYFASGLHCNAHGLFIYCQFSVCFSWQCYWLYPCRFQLVCLTFPWIRTKSKTTLIFSGFLWNRNHFQELLRLASEQRLNAKLFIRPASSGSLDWLVQELVWLIQICFHYDMISCIFCFE